MGTILDIICLGTAEIKHAISGQILILDEDKLEWEAISGDEGGMGVEHVYEATYKDDNFGILTWTLSEYPAGVQNYKNTSVGNHTLLKDFEYSLIPTSDFNEYREALFNEMVSWFHDNYEDPANYHPHESREGGYEYIWGGPFDASEVLFAQYPNVSVELLEDAVEEIEVDGIVDWGPVDKSDLFVGEGYVENTPKDPELERYKQSIIEQVVNAVVSKYTRLEDAGLNFFDPDKINPQAYSVKEIVLKDFPNVPEKAQLSAVEILERHGEFWVDSADLEAHKRGFNTPKSSDDLIQIPTIPSDQLGIAFKLDEAGKISPAFTGYPEKSELDEVKGFQEVALEAVTQVTIGLQGTNAHTNLYEVITAYHKALSKSPICIDQLYVRGIRLENENLNTQYLIKSGELPDLPEKIVEPLTSALSIHGLLISSTSKGRELLERSKLYNQNEFDVARYKAASTKFSLAVQQSNGVFSEETIEEVSELNDEIGVGKFPERSTEASKAASNNLLKTVFKAAGGIVVLGGISNSVPANIAIDAVTALTNASWVFLVENWASIQALVVAGGPDMNWVTTTFEWLKHQKEKMGK